MLLVQQFLLNHTFGQLDEVHGVEISVDSRNGHKFSLNYNQIRSIDSDPLAQQCRGLILSNGSSLFPQARMKNGRKNYDHICPGSTQVLAHPMNRFFNAGQGCAAPINWSDPQLKVFEKLDGTLCIVHFDQIIHEWHVATRSVPEADIPLECQLYTFRTLFEKALAFTAGGTTFQELCKILNPHNTYCFELTTPYNRVVVDYKESTIALLAVRDKFTGIELLPENEACTKYVPVVGSYNIADLQAAMDYVNSRSPMDHEGIVVRDSKWNRQKVKNPGYVAYSKARDSLSSSPRGILELILNEKDDDVMPYMPEDIQANIKKMKAKVSSLMSNFEQDFKNVLITTAFRRENDPAAQDWPEQKLFALTVKDAKIWSPPCFKIFSGKCTNLQDYIKKARFVNSEGVVEGTWSNSFLDSVLEQIGWESIWANGKTKSI
jgi:hypothetical protein